MSGNNPFYIVDVFAEKKYNGNQLAVFLQAESIPSEEMQHLAREMNFSETSFILSHVPRNGGYDVRIFTPGEEVPFAGHPTLGTAHVIRQVLLEGRADTVKLNLKVGQIPVRFDKDQNGWMTQIEPFFGTVHPRENLAPILNLAPDDIDDRFPVQEVSTGLPFFIVPLKNLSALQRARVNRDLYFPFIQGTLAKGILVFCPGARNPLNDISVRVFVDCYGIPEDPATGSGNGCLAGYLIKHRFLGQPSLFLRVEQGYDMNRPALLKLRAEEEGKGAIRIQVGGQALTLARGELL
jgi:trans-2,3-dihydro-3-hydroxyanthranilate isomerase